MIITVNTDASFSNRHKKGAYAFWIVSNAGRILKSGPIRSNCFDSNDAEMRCIINALHTVAGTAELNRPGNLIIVNTDSMNAIHIFTRDRWAKKRFGLNKNEYSKVNNEIGKVRNKLAGVRIEFRHVRSHTGIGDKRSYVNEWCDRAAKDELGKILDLPLI